MPLPEGGGGPYHYYCSGFLPITDAEAGVDCGFVLNRYWDALPVLAEGTKPDVRNRFEMGSMAVISDAPLSGTDPLPSGGPIQGFANSRHCCVKGATTPQRPKKSTSMDTGTPKTNRSPNAAFCYPETNALAQRTGLSVLTTARTGISGSRRTEHPTRYQACDTTGSGTS